MWGSVPERSENAAAEVAEGGTSLRPHEFESPPARAGMSSGMDGDTDDLRPAGTRSYRGIPSQRNASLRTNIVSATPDQRPSPRGLPGA